MRTLLCIAILAQFWACARAHAEEFNSAGVKIHYTTSGQGDPVLLVHGLYSSAKMNWELPGLTAALARSHQVIASDCRGHGQSDKPEADDQYGVPMAEDVVRLMDHLHIQKAKVAGYSMGGMIVMKLLTRHPDRVTAAVFGGMGWLKSDSPLERFWEVLPARRAQRAPAACLHGIAKLAVTEEEVKAVRVPVTLIAGERDPCRRLYIEPLRRVRPDWPDHVIAGAGHLNCIMKAEFKEQLLAALQATPPPSAPAKTP